MALDGHDKELGTIRIRSFIDHGDNTCIIQHQEEIHLTRRPNAAIKFNKAKYQWKTKDNLHLDVNALS